MEPTVAKYLFVEGQDDADFFDWLKTKYPAIMEKLTIKPLIGNANHQILANHLGSIVKQGIPAHVYFVLDSDGNNAGTLKKQMEALVSGAIGKLLNQPPAAATLDINGWNRLTIKGVEVHIAVRWVAGQGSQRPITELEDLIFHLLPTGRYKASDCFEHQWVPCVGEPYLSEIGISRKELNKLWNFILRNHDLSTSDQRKKEDSWSAVLARHPDLFDAHSPLLAPYLTFFQTQPTP